MTRYGFKTKSHELRNKESSALIITLVVMLLITLLVVSMSGMVGEERATSHNAFENERARNLGNLAIDEVVATLRDNIPTNSLWAVAPGQLTYFVSQSVSSNVNLYSGVSNTVTGGVDLNAPILGSSVAGSYPIIPTNGTYGTTPPTMIVGWNLVLQDGEIIRPGGSTSTINAVSNPVIGRYAYWVDPETCKVNLNEAGKGQTTCTFNTTSFTTNDSQNLTGSPTRADLSQLDGGITTNQSIATYHYTYGGYFGGDYYTNFGTYGTALLAASNPLTNISNTAREGGQRFDSIQQWTTLTNDSFAAGTFGASNVAMITPSQVEKNKFYLTTKSRTPEITPWGYNRSWWQAVGAEAIPVTSTMAEGGAAGNRANGRDIPAYPYLPSGSSTVWPGTNWPGGYGGTNNSWFGANADGYHSQGVAHTDTRFYYYPFDEYANYWSSAYARYDMQWMGSFGNQGIISAKDYGTLGGNSSQPYIHCIMQLLSRTDWPGMPQNQSFVTKYGTNECIDLADNLQTLFADTIQMSGPSPFGFAGNQPDWDPNGYYGFFLQNCIYNPLNTNSTLVASTNSTQVNAYTNITSNPNLPINGANHLYMPSALEVPLINQLAVTFTATTNGATITPSPVAAQTNNSYADTNASAQVYSAPTAGNANTSMWTNWTTNGTSYPGGYTKDGIGDGFVPAIATLGTNNQGLRGGTFMNVQLQPACNLYYPPTFKDTFASALWTGNGPAGPYIMDVVVSATGTYTPPGTSTPYPVTYGATNVATVTSDGDGKQYYWGMPDDHPLFPISTNTGAKPSGKADGLTLTPVAGGSLGNFVPGSSMACYLAKPLFIGPFDTNTVANVTVCFRAGSACRQPNTASPPYEITPMGFNYGTPGTAAAPPGSTGGGGFAEYGKGSQEGTGGVGGDGQAYTNVLFSMAGSNNYFSPVLSFSTSLNLTAGTSSVARYDLVDPRVYRYTNDWIADSSATTANYGIVTNATFLPITANGVTYTTNFADPLTGVTGDYSKLTFPSIGPLYYWAKQGGTLDPRSIQFANNITCFPGVGWLSVLNLNNESSQGTPTTGGSGTTSHTPIPWRTLSLSPATSTSQLPDWLLLDIFAIAYDSTYLSQTDGKINPNTSLFPQSWNINRGKPMAALIQPSNYVANVDNPTFSLSTITNALALGPNSANSANYTVGPAGLLTNMLMYQGQMCQYNASVLGGTGSTGATNQWQAESLMRSLVGTITTKSSDFKVNIVAQAVKQLPGTSGGLFNPNTSLVVTSEQRMSAVVSRDTTVNASGPGGSGNTYGYSVTNASTTIAMPDENVDGNAPAMWEPTDVTNYAVQPSFNYTVSDITYMNN